jgi:hypothetical protein
MRKLLITTLLAAAACSSNSDKNPPGDDQPPPPPGTDGGTTDPTLRQDADDVAAVVGANLNVAELPAMRATIDLAFGRVPDGFTEDIPGSLPTGKGSVTGVFGGLTYAIAYECHSAGEVVIACNGAEDHTRMVVKFSGAMATADVSTDGVSESGVWYVRGIATGPHIGGKGKMTFVSTLATGTYTVSLTEDSGHLLFDAAAPLLPSGGTDDFVLTVHRTRVDAEDRDFTVNAHVEVVGPDAATLTLDDTDSYNITLSTGVVVHL